MLLISNKFTRKGVWSPIRLPESRLWLDARDVSTFTFNSSNISQWIDKTAGRRFQQATSGNQPVYDTTGFNGLPCLSFNGSSQLLRTPAGGPGAIDNANILRNTAQAMAYIVIETGASFSSGRALFISTPTSAIPKLALYSSASGLHSMIGRRLNSDTNQVINTGANTRSLSTKYIQGALVDYSGANAKIRINGSELVSATFQTAGLAADGNPSATSVGAESNGANYFLGKIAEVVVAHTSDLSESQKLEGYLAHKWGMASTLPNDHPYKNLPPL
ncbi:hypothetical protein [Anabaena sp. CCY 9910]|uniref:hypothetical protein n=1 Tax=Anabaena sp. CCY 9910 TaxID=3103870 RepID=UPI0039E0AAAB